MIDNNTRVLLSELKMDHMIEVLKNQERVPEFLAKNFDERLQFAVADYYAMKSQEKMEALVKKANFKYPKIGVNCIDYLPERHLNKDLILNLA
ncbi:MAG: hypothetical protein KBS81_10510, partial [Spirochaetales bacterium]|nr:hypothetical protein [Candidatus Physcosoma equi]